MQLLNPLHFREIVSGRRQSLAAALFRALTAAIEKPMQWAVSWRNRRYDSGRASITRAEAPVISVGNITLGGTGKTPLVAWVAREIERTGRGVTLISRGYGGRDGERNDEARELALCLPNVPHLQNPDRVAAARDALRQAPESVLVLDDAFQHRRLARDLDLVLLDALEPFGFERLFPRGTLREPPASLARAQAVILTRADLIDADQRERLRERVAGLAPHALWAEVCFRPEQLRNAAGEVQPLAALQGQSVIAFCGIGNPAGFEKTLTAAEFKVLALQPFQDHQAYGARELIDLVAWAKRYPQANAIICTLKDLVKISDTTIANLPLWALEIDVQFLQGEAELRQRLIQTLEKVEKSFDGRSSAT